MLRTLLLAGSAVMAVPAIAQTAPNDQPLDPVIATDSQAYPSTGVLPVDDGVADPSPTISPSTDPAIADSGAEGTMTAASDAYPADAAAAEIASYEPYRPYAMRDWNFSGDLGAIGSPEWGTRISESPSIATADASMAASSTYTGMGGPIDVDAEWAAIAPAGDQLTPLEFGIWLLEENGQDVDGQVESSLRSRASNLPAVQVLNVTARALAQADTNRDWRVSRDELMVFAAA